MQVSHFPTSLMCFLSHDACPAAGGRLILELLPAKSGGKKGKTGKGERVEPEEKLRIGSLVSGIVKEAHQLFVVLQISEGARTHDMLMGTTMWDPSCGFVLNG